MAVAHIVIGAMDHPRRQAGEYRPSGIRRLLRSRLGILGSALVMAAVLAAIVAPFVGPYEPNEISLPDRLLPPLSGGRGGGMHVLGTDQLGRDVFSRVLYGARVSLLVGTMSVTLAGAIGFAAGLMAGQWGGILDTVVMRMADLQLAFPFILLALAIVSLVGASFTNLIIVFVATTWPVYARTVRASVLVVRAQDYIEAARSLGASWSRILFRHIFFNVLAPVLVIGSFEMARVIIVEAAMGFLGLGVPPPTPTWGNMLADGREYIRDAWWLSTFPGLAIMLLAAGVNFLGDAARDVLDPRLR